MPDACPIHSEAPLPHYETPSQQRAVICPACKRPKDLKTDKPATQGVKIRPLKVTKRSTVARHRKKDPRYRMFY